MKVVLLGPDGQLGYDIRKAHDDAGVPFELLPVGRDRLDVTAPDLEERLAQWSFDILVNCTGYHKTDEVEDNAGLAFAVNAHAVQGMAHACARQAARLVHVSTDYVFGGDTKRRTPLCEEDLVAPVNVYGASKLLGETLARLACEDVVVVRVASLFGAAGASGKAGNFVETMLRLAREQGQLKVVDDQVMSPTATADVARVLMRMLLDGCAPGTYHAVNGGEASWYDFACEILRRSTVFAEVVPCVSDEFPSRAKRPAYSALDNAKVSRAFGALAPWQDALGRYLGGSRQGSPRQLGAPRVVARRHNEKETEPAEASGANTTRVIQWPETPRPAEMEWAKAYELPVPGNMLKPGVDALGIWIRQGTRMASQIRDVIRTHYDHAIAPDLSVLDFGCGNGRVALPLYYALGYPTVCFDVDPVCVDYVSRVLPDVEVCRTSLMPPAPIADATFDVVYAISVWTHLSPEVADLWLAEVRRMLKPGGLAIITTSGYAALASRRKRMADWRDIDDDLLRREGCIYKVGRYRPRGVSGAESYGYTAHDPSWVSERWRAGFEFVETRPSAIENLQDCHIMRHPG